MKIIIIPNMPAFSGRHLDIANNLIKQGHDVNYFHWELPYGVSLKNIWRHLITSLSVKNYKLEKLEIHKVIRLPYFWPVINGWIFKWQLRKLFKKLDADIIITESYTNETEVPKDLPFIYDLADDYAAPADVYGSPIYKLAFKLLGVKKVMKRQCQNALAVTAVSDILVKYASKYNKNVYKLPNGVDTEIIKKIKKAKNINPHSMIYVTGFGKWSRAIETLEAVVKLKKVFPRLELTLAGSGIESENMKKFIYKNNAENYIHYLGFINDRKKVFGLINSHAIGLNISDKNKWRDAAHPIKVIEYSSFGKKVVSTDLDEVNNLKYPNLFIFSDKSKNNNLINTLRRALIDTRTDKEFSNASEKVLTKYDWKKITSNLLGIVKKHKKETVNNKRRIVHVTPSYPPALGGLENVVQSLAREQYKSGEYVEVITTKADKKLKVDSEGFPVTRLSSWTFASTKIIPGFIFELLKLNKNDIVHLHVISAFMPEIVWLVSKIKRFRYIVHLHLNLEPTTKAGLLLKIYKPLVLKTILISAGNLVVFSKDQKVRVHSEYGVEMSNISVIPNGVEDKFYHEIERVIRKKPRLLFVGRFEMQKNISQLLTALKGISDKFETTLVGEGSLLNDLKQLAGNLKLSGINFVGRADGQALLNYYKQSDIFVLPSAREGMPLALLEATAMGLPIVATDVTGNREIVRSGENGILVPFGNSKMLSEALLKIRSDKKLYAKFSKGAKKIAKNYSWKKVAKEFEKLYGQLNNQTVNKNLIIKNDNKKKDNNSAPFKLWHLLIPALIISNLAYLLNNYFGSAVTLLFFLFVPGYLFLKIITNEIKSRWEIASFSLGLSLLLLMLGGLALNTLNIFGLKEPLTTFNIFVMLDTLTIALLFFNRNKTFDLPKRINFNFPLKNIVMFILLSILPFLAAGGAISLNNGGPNTLTMILFGLIPVLFVILVWRRDMESMYPYAVFMMGLSILFTNSLRGWFITGHDIHHEYSVFMNTFNNNLWPVRLATGDPYNACLSITILPTILAKISAISTMYIYKFLFQVIFAFGLIPIYLFIKKISNLSYALIGALIFISFPPFINDMPFLNRQEIAFIFFPLIFLINFMEISKKTKIILTITLILGLIFSHYSSNYVMLSLIIPSWIFYKLLSFKKIVNKDIFLPISTLPIIALSMFLTVLWNSHITLSASNLSQTVDWTIKGLLRNDYSQSSGVTYALFSAEPVDFEKLLAEYAREKAKYVKYVPEENLPITRLGEFISSIIDVEQLNKFIRGWSAKSLQVLFIVGIVILFIKQNKSRSKKEKYYLALILTSLSLLIFITVLPQFSISYSVTRLFQQVLIIIALPIIIATHLVFKYFKEYKTHAVAIYFAFLFAHLSGFIPQLLGGYPPQLALNNSGIYYDIYLSNESEIYSSKWVNDREIYLNIAADPYARQRFENYPLSKQHFNDILSSTSNYFYMNKANTMNNKYTKYLNGNLVQFTYYKNIENNSLLYNNGVSKFHSRK